MDLVGPSLQFENHVGIRIPCAISRAGEDVVFGGTRDQDQESNIEPNGQGARDKGGIPELYVWYVFIRHLPSSLSGSILTRSHRSVFAIGHPTGLDLNRPSHMLSIFMPWHPSSCASPLSALFHSPRYLDVTSKKPINALTSYLVETSMLKRCSKWSTSAVYGYLSFCKPNAFIPDMAM